MHIIPGILAYQHMNTSSTVQVKLERIRKIREEKMHVPIVKEAPDTGILLDDYLLLYSGPPSLAQCYTTAYHTASIPAYHLYFIRTSKHSGIPALLPFWHYQVAIKV